VTYDWLPWWLVYAYYFTWVGMGGRGMGGAYTLSHKEGHHRGVYVCMYVCMHILAVGGGRRLHALARGRPYNVYLVLLLYSGNNVDLLLLLLEYGNKVYRLQQQ
jgi:hypothetical protein